MSVLAKWPQVKSGAMFIKWKGWFICAHEGCPEADGATHVWASKTLPERCGKCKRFTWNRADKRLKKPGVKKSGGRK